MEARFYTHQDLRNDTVYSGNILKMIIFAPYIAVLRKSYIMLSPPLVIDF